MTRVVLVCLVCFIGILDGREVKPSNPFSLRNDGKNIFELGKKVIFQEEKPILEELEIEEDPILITEEIPPLTEKVTTVTEPKLVESKKKSKPLNLPKKMQPRKKEITSPPPEKVTSPLPEKVTSPPQKVPQPPQEVTPPLTPLTIIPSQKATPPSNHVLISVTEKEPERIKGEQIVNLVLWGIFSIVSIGLFWLYLQRRSRLAQRSSFDGALLQPHLHDELRQLKIDYRGLEQIVKEIEASLEPLRQLNSRSIEELTSEIVNKNTQQINKTIAELKDFYKNLADEISKISQRLSVLDEIKGKNLKEFVHQEINKRTNDWDKFVRDDLMHHINLNKQLFSQLSERVDRRIDDIHKQNQQLSAEIKEIISRLDEFELSVSSSSSFGVPQKRPKQAINIEETEMDRLHHQIYNLADEGLSVDDIAQRVNLGKAEVRLILDLRKPEEKEKQQ